MARVNERRRSTSGADPRSTELNAEENFDEPGRPPQVLRYDRRTRRCGRRLRGRGRGRVHGQPESAGVRRADPHRHDGSRVAHRHARFRTPEGERPAGDRTRRGPAARGPEPVEDAPDRDEGAHARGSGRRHDGRLDLRRCAAGQHRARPPGRLDRVHAAQRGHDGTLHRLPRRTDAVEPQLQDDPSEAGAQLQLEGELPGRLHVPLRHAAPCSST